MFTVRWVFRTMPAEGHRSIKGPFERLGPRAESP
jgi:hypothetical protein